MTETEETGLAVVETQSRALVIPVATVANMVGMRKEVARFVKDGMVESIDYDWPPNALDRNGKPKKGAKRDLLKAGCEKIVQYFGLTPVFRIVKEDTRLDPRDPASNYIFIRTECDLIHRESGMKIVQGASGSCNSMEDKYSWRWVFSSDLPDWLTQEQKKQLKTRSISTIQGRSTLYRVANEAIADLANTIEKMSAKRAFKAATLMAVSVSDLFTQDLEDLPEELHTAVATDGEAQEPATPKKGRQKPPTARQKAAGRGAIPPDSPAGDEPPPPGDEDAPPGTKPAATKPAAAPAAEKPLEPEPPEEEAEAGDLFEDPTNPLTPKSSLWKLLVERGTKMGAIIANEKGEAVSLALSGEVAKRLGAKTGLYPMAKLTLGQANRIYQELHP